MSKYIYEVRMQVPGQVFEDYLCWLKAHVTEMLELPCFTNAEIQQEISPIEGFKNLRCFYEYSRPDDFAKYLSEYAPAMRGQLDEDIKSQIKFERSNYKRLD